MSSTSWASISWVPVGSGWKKHGVPYQDNATYLQTCDIWTPERENFDSSDSSSVPSHYGPWIVYIHGGAWRDPLVDSTSFEPTARILLENYSEIAGLVSINYRLSSKLEHPNHPSPPRDKMMQVDVARMARHPDHIEDVLKGVKYLQSLGMAHRYILVGHSCGATLALQLLADPKRWGLDIVVLKPTVLVGLNGLYDLPKFLKNPDTSHAALVPLYYSFTHGAFGHEEQVWAEACPTSVTDWTTEWPEGRKVIFVQSPQDSLVPYSQTKIMKENMAFGQSTKRILIEEVETSGDHNDLWKDGARLSEILIHALSDFLI